MNVVATSLRIRERPSVVPDARSSTRGRSGQPLETMRRRCLRIGDELGFLFGSGLPANFLAEYYAPSGYGPARAAWLLLRAFFSALWHGPFVRQAVQALRGLGARRRRAARADGVRRPDGAGRSARWAWASSSSTAPTTIRSASACWRCTRPALSLVARRAGRCSAAAASRPAARSAPSPRRWTFIPKNGAHGLHDRRRPLPDARSRSRSPSDRTSTS